MAGTTSKLTLPYPTGTDRVADGDNAMEALARRIEARMAWGDVGKQLTTIPQTGIGTAEVNLGALTMTANLLAGRVYRIEARGCAIPDTIVGGAVFRLGIYLNGVAIQFAETPMTTVAGIGLYVSTIHIPTSSLLPATLSFTGSTAGGVFATFHAAANRPGFSIVTDLGAPTA